MRKLHIWALVIPLFLACGDDADPGLDSGARDGGLDAFSAPDGGDAGTDAGCFDCGGTCVDPESDVQHCGGCDMGCAARAGATATCADAACDWTCDDGFGDCDGDEANGCETDLLLTDASCGACGNVCSSEANATGKCVDGSCDQICDPGWDDCDGDPSNGCETDLSSIEACGGCGTVCAAGLNALPACVDGACALTCQLGYADCDGDATPGCEANLGAVDSCGVCGNVCATPANSTAMCADGTCRSVCNAGFADCDGAAGCEVDLRTSLDHCGACDAACTVGSNATASCDAGVCTAICDPGFGACGTPSPPPSAGCLFSLDTRDDCGACGVRCEHGPGVEEPMCVDGACVNRCMPEWGDCDGNAVNGCEANLAGDANNCGSCGFTCLRSEACAGGGCIPRRLVFVTSTTVVPSTLGNLAAADAICQTRANAAGLSGSYQAWLSTSTQNPAARLTRSPEGWARTDGTTVAVSWADLTDGSIAAPINRDEFGAMVPDSVGGSGTCDYSNVITNTRPNGTSNPFYNCNDLTGGGGTAAETRTTSSRWTEGCAGGAFCSRPMRLYCFQQ